MYRTWLKSECALDARCPWARLCCATFQLLQIAKDNYTFLHFCSQLAVGGDDYTATSGSLIFEEGDLTKSFTLSIGSDSVPELDEYIHFHSHHLCGAWSWHCGGCWQLWYTLSPFLLQHLQYFSITFPWASSPLCCKLSYDYLPQNMLVIVSTLVCTAGSEFYPILPHLVLPTSASVTGVWRLWWLLKMTMLVESCNYPAPHMKLKSPHRTVSRGAGSFGTVRHAARTSLKLSLLSVSLPRGGHGFFACSCHGNDLIHMYTKFHL